MVMPASLRAPMAASAASCTTSLSGYRPNFSIVPPTSATSLTFSSLQGPPGSELVEYPELGCDDVVPVAVGAHLLGVHLDLLAEPLRAGVIGVQAVDVAADGDALRQVDDVVDV